MANKIEKPKDATPTYWVVLNADLQVHSYINAKEYSFSDVKEDLQTLSLVGCFIGVEPVTLS